MIDYISREAVRLIESDSEAYAEAWNASYEEGFCDAIKAVLELPAADVAEVRVGTWAEKYVDDRTTELNPFMRRRLYCSACGCWNTHGKSRYCPKCGAKMDGGAYNGES